MDGVHTFQEEYLSIPIVTRGYTTACVFTTLAVVSKKKLSLFT